MIYDDSIQKICAFCARSIDFDDSTVLCDCKGPVSPDYHCRKYRYDPLRRKPAPPIKVKKVLTAKAFEL